MEKFVSKIYNSFFYIIQRKTRTRTQPTNKKKKETRRENKRTEDREQRVQTIWLFVIRLEPKDTFRIASFLLSNGLYISSALILHFLQTLLVTIPFSLCK